MRIITRDQALRAAAELRKRQLFVKPIFDSSHKPQNEFVQNKSRFISAVCTRRAGKSHGLGIKFFNKGKKYPGSLIPYIGLTRESCKNIMWPALKDIDKQYNLKCEFLDSRLEVVMPNKTIIKLFGADQKNFIDKLRGPKYPIVGIDEAQAFKSHIEALVDDVLTPAIGDYTDGQIVLTGTPGPVPKGYFYDTTLGKFGFDVNRWGVYDNPYFPNPHDFVAELFAKKGWTKDHPTYLREWLGQWVSDPDALVYKFNDQKNRIDLLPSRKDYYYVMGVDLGFADPSAFVVCAYHKYDKHLYIIETFQDTEMSVSQVAERVKYYCGKYQNLQVIMDAGGLGVMVVDEIRTRYGIPVLAAIKQDKEGFIEIMNSDLQSGTIKLVGDSAEILKDEWQALIWDSESLRRIEDSRYPNHCADAALYAWRHCYNYGAQQEPSKIRRDSEEYIDKRMKEMFDESKQLTEDDLLYGI